MAKTKANSGGGGKGKGKGTSSASGKGRPSSGSPLNRAAERLNQAANIYTERHGNPSQAELRSMGQAAKVNIERVGTEYEDTEKRRDNDLSRQKGIARTQTAGIGARGQNRRTDEMNRLSGEIERRGGFAREGQQGASKTRNRGAAARRAAQTRKSRGGGRK